MAGYQLDKINGIECWKMKNDDLTLWLSKNFGPRVLGLSYRGSENLMASLPDARLPIPGGGEYSLRGGHRLWYAPERPETTYILDDQPPQVNEIEDGLEFIQEVDPPTGIQKSWVIKLAPGDSKVVLDHRLVNQGGDPFELAPWAVTMLRPGGVGLLPVEEGIADENGLWPNRELIFWPYTDLESKHLQVINQGVFVFANMEAGALKVGTPNPRGWIAYRHNGLLFVKKTGYLKGKRYLDRGASHQIYVNPDVIELETLGPRTELTPGQAVDHQEIWHVYPPGDWPGEILRIYKMGGILHR